MKFKIGDSVMFNGGKVVILSNATCNCHDFEIEFEDGVIGSAKELELTPIIKDMSNLEVGDIVVNTDGGERMVLGICGRVHFMSYKDDFNEVAFSVTKEYLIEDGYTLKQPTPETKVETITIGDHKYHKLEVEEALKNIKAL